MHNELDVPHQKTIHRELSLQPGGERLSDETSGGGGKGVSGQNAVMQSTRTGFKQTLAFPENCGKFGNSGSNG